MNAIQAVRELQELRELNRERISKQRRSPGACHSYFEYLSNYVRFEAEQSPVNRRAYVS